MQHLEVSCAVRPIQWPLGVKWLMFGYCNSRLVITDVMKGGVAEGMCTILSILTTSVCMIRDTKSF